MTALIAREINQPFSVIVPSANAVTRFFVRFRSRIWKARGSF
jgi:hypothetical protein